ncbi:MAG: hypothetical protein KAZ71_02700 [Bacteroidia bacterium]|jgi:hypothetical protein|nr:hypothetical protein [Bacteroidia bacterium]
MKKQIVLALASFIFLFNSTTKAQDNTAYEKGTIVATVGYGFPDLYRTSLRLAYNGYNSTKVRGFGPLILKGDYGIYKFKWGHSVGAGIVIGFNSTSVKFTDNYYDYYNNNYNLITYNETHTFRTITVGARGTYHFFTKEKLDCYASVGLGFNINSTSRTTDNPNGYTAIATARSGLYETFTVGIRYYFTKNIGVYSELGWDMSAPIQAGVALKF